MKILTDRGSQFTSALYSKMCALYGTRSLLTTSYRPQNNGANERTHKEIKRYLAMFMGIKGAETKHPVPWDILVPYASWAYNTTYHAVLRMSPYEALFNRPPQVHALGALGGEYRIAERITQMFGDDQDENSPKTSGNLSGEDAEFFRLLSIDREKAESIRAEITKYLTEAQQRWSKSPAKLETRPAYQSGDYILLRNMVATANTMSPKYTGPYEVTARKGPVTYEISRPESHFSRTGGRDWVHPDRMKLYHDPNPGQPIKPLFLQSDDELEKDKTLKIMEITPAGLDAITRLPADTHIPVPVISKYYVDRIGQIQENTAHLLADASDRPLAENDVDNIRIAPDDLSRNPIQLHDEQIGTVTRAKAKRIGLKISDLWPFGKKK
jgi:hypothetical protein